MNGLDILMKLIFTAFAISAVVMCSGCSTLNISPADIDLANQIWYTHQLSK